MANGSSSQEALHIEPIVLRRRPSSLNVVIGLAKRKPLGAIGAILVIGLLFIAIFAPYVAPYDPYQIYADNVLTPPDRTFLLGTDELGRDVLSRIIFGARISLYVGFLCIATGITLGAFVGVISAYYGGTFDLVVQRIIDAIMAFPGLILALAIMAALGQSLNNVVIALAVVQIPNAARVLRSQSLSVKQSQYVEAAKAIGCSDSRIIFQHIMPNCVAPYLIVATAALAYVIVREASLSFLGVGTPPPIPSWGGMLTKAAQQYVQTAPWVAISPGIALSLAVFGINLLGDAIRDVLDPRLRGR